MLGGRVVVCPQPSLAGRILCIPYPGPSSQPLNTWTLGQVWWVLVDSRGLELVSGTET